ncbi:hypothetical protein GH714_001476 [Hevea brasiliensis]|uniref:Retrovirus-related Pol polyprotein from transposon TNT 1-94-like beta-barrel domain-containing protein n=1 Tax=Hevea brasiliensis TaxID=3981 RepID=A0A6A6N7R3_HEVBR|nr:hypothetical protein GH714_001476 [Hevea brasiliensis]
MSPVAKAIIQATEEAMVVISVVENEVAELLDIRVVEIKITMRKRKLVNLTNFNAITVTNLAILKDSGCSSHMTANLEAFANMDKSVQTTVKMGDGMVNEARGKGDVQINSTDNKCVKSVLYVLHLDSNILSGMDVVEGLMLDARASKDVFLSTVIYKDESFEIAPNQCCPSYGKTRKYFPGVEMALLARMPSEIHTA